MAQFDKQVSLMFSQLKEYTLQRKSLAEILGPLSSSAPTIAHAPTINPENNDTNLVIHIENYTALHKTA